MIGPNVRVSADEPSLAFYETQIAADPQSPDHLIACAFREQPGEDSGVFDNVFYVSFDGGRSWTHTLTVPRSVDPSCIIGVDGVAYAASVQDSAGTGDSYLNVQRSPDGGRTWQESTVTFDTRSMDRAYITADDTDGPLRGHVYVHGYLSDRRDANGDPMPPEVVLYTSADGGRTFDRSTGFAATEFADPWFFPANGTVAADGAFAALIVELDRGERNMFLGRSDAASAPSEANAVLKVMRSRDGGRSVAVADVTEAFYDWRTPQLSMSAFAVDRSEGPFHGRIYAAWPDARAERRTQIFFSRSDDGGMSWNTPVIVSDDASAQKPTDRPNNLMPMVSVNQDGTVGVAWYDRRDNPNNVSYWPRFAASLDGGDHWLPSIRVSEHPNDMPEDEFRPNGGDTSGLTADAEGTFHLLWIDNRTGTNQMWTATARVDGSVQAPSAAWLERLHLGLTHSRCCTAETIAYRGLVSREGR